MLARRPGAGSTSRIDKLAVSVNDATAGLTKGSRVWYKKDDQTWLAAELKSQPVSYTNPDGSPAPSAPDATCSIQLEGGRGETITVPQNRILPANPKLQDAIPDLTHLSYLNEPGILANLAQRYSTDAIYAFAGPVLIALNPCKALPLYTPEVANLYKGGAKDVVHSLPPHIYLVAANAFRKMIRERESQSLIVNGESGAGKTETTKKAMQYFATLAGGTGVEDQVLETNPILEAFGNAKTLRNHNSSRFGKLIQIHFNQSNHICGACIKTYLLEKSRVVHQLKGERSYHIFYQLVRGASPEERSALRLPPDVNGFRFLSQSGCTSIEGVNDAREFMLVRAALADIGIDPSAQASLWALLSGILWLGNLDFVYDHADANTDSTVVSDTEALAHACFLLNVDPALLCSALTSKQIIAPGEIITKVLNVEESQDARDALAKSIYSAIFDWIVAQINAKLDTGKKTSGLHIAILDIYGFEQFTRNSFEQLCINYANERLQQQFTRHLFALEQEEYESEGIDWTKVEFVDNQECVDVIDQVPPKGLGVLAVLDAQCRFPKASDDTFVQKLKETLSGHSHFALNPRSPGDFSILHYAGLVQYDSAGFLDKNKDTLSNDLIELMLSSAGPLLRHLGSGVRDEMESASRRGQTVGMRFAGQLRELISGLDLTGLHFVRCIKPNAALLPNKFEAPMTLHQLRCCGVLEVARIAAAGFPTRYSHTQFAERYAILLPPAEQKVLAGGPGVQACQSLINKFGLLPGQYQLGRTKVFFRPGVLGLVEDRWAKMQSAATTMQCTWRMSRQRRAYQAIRSAAIAFQSVYRTVLQRRIYLDMQAQYRAAMTVQRLWRGHFARTKYLSMQHSAVSIQMAWRRYKLSRRVKVRRQAREKREFIAKMEQESFASLRKEYGVADMDEVRSALKLLRAQAQAGSAGSAGGAAAGAAIAGAAGTAAGSAAGGADGPREFRVLPASAAGAADGGGGAAAAAAGAAPGLVGSIGMPPSAVSLGRSGSNAGFTAGPFGGASGAQAAFVAGGQGSASGHMSAVAMAGRFEAVKEMGIQVERLQLENVKLQKQLQLERSLKDRYQHKYEEQNVNWLEQIRVLQDYITQVRATYGDHRLPPLPAAAAAATQPSSSAPTAGSSGSTTFAALPERTIQRWSSGGANANGRMSGSFAGMRESASPPNELAAGMSSGGGGDVLTFHAMPAGNGQSVLSPLQEVDGDVQRRFNDGRSSSAGGSGGGAHLGGRDGHVQNQFNNFGGQYSGGGAGGSGMHDEEPITPSHDGLGPPQNSYPRSTNSGVHAGVGGSPNDLSTTSGRETDEIAYGHSSGGGAPNGRQMLPPQPQTASQKYVGQLNGELGKISHVLEDDVDFIRDAKEGRIDVPDMDPNVELSKLKKKFDFWKREFKEKLKTTEEVLRKIDRMERTRPHNNLAVSRSNYVPNAPAPTPDYRGGGQQQRQPVATPLANGTMPGGQGNGTGATPGSSNKKRGGIMNLFKS